MGFKERYLPYATIALNPVLGRLRGSVDSWRRFYEGGEDPAISGARLVDEIAAIVPLYDKHAILDLGCGPGRIVRPLLDRVAPDASYRGLDIDRRVIRTARQEAPKDRDVAFVQAPVRNQLYNLLAGMQPSDFRFPFDSDSFDLALAISLFTHMKEEDLQAYLQQLSRVVQPNGTFVGTFFLVDTAPQAYGFVSQVGNYTFTTEPDIPEMLIAHNEHALIEQLDQAGFDVQDVQSGTWREGGERPTQDILVARLRN